MTAILFGSISTIADTSELQRQAYNQAFAAHGLDWTWDQDEYRSLLDGNGGQDRVARYAEARGQDVDAQAIHQTKSDQFQQALADGSLAPRAGVAETVRAARAAGTKVALVTTTSAENVHSLLRAVDGLGADDFDLLVDASSVDATKPDPASYRFALDQLGEQAANCVAIEDNAGGIESAASASVRCVAFPNENTAVQSFDGAVQRVDAVDFADLTSLIESA